MPETLSTARTRAESDPRNPDEESHEGRIATIGWSDIVDTVARHVAPFADVYHDEGRALLAVAHAEGGRVIAIRRDGEPVILRDREGRPVAAAAGGWAMVAYSTIVGDLAAPFHVFFAGHIGSRDIPTAIRAIHELRPGTLSMPDPDAARLFAAVIGRDHVRCTSRSPAFVEILADAVGVARVAGPPAFGELGDAVTLTGSVLHERLGAIESWGTPPPQYAETAFEAYCEALTRGVVDPTADGADVSPASTSALLAALRSRLRERIPIGRFEAHGRTWHVYNADPSARVAWRDVIAIAETPGRVCADLPVFHPSADFRFSETKTVAFATSSGTCEAFVSPRVLPLLRGRLVHVLRDRDREHDRDVFLLAASLLVGSVRNTNGCLVLTGIAPVADSSDPLFPKR